MKYLLLIGTVLFIWSTTVHAQIIGGGDAVDIIGDEITLSTQDGSTPDIDNQTQTIAQSVTTGGGGGNYAPNSNYISNLDQALFSGVNSQNYVENFPGWVKLPPNSTTIAEGLTKTLLTTYGNALQGAQSQSQELEGEDFSNLENANTQAAAVLQAIQVNTEAQLQVAQQLQYVRQLIISLVTIEATRSADELNERAQAAATSAESPLAIVKH